MFFGGFAPPSPQTHPAHLSEAELRTLESLDLKDLLGSVGLPRDFFGDEDLGYFTEKDESELLQDLVDFTSEEALKAAGKKIKLGIHFPNNRLCLRFPVSAFLWLGKSLRCKALFLLFCTTPACERTRNAIKQSACCMQTIRSDSLCDTIFC